MAKKKLWTRKFPFPSAAHMYDKQWPAMVPSYKKGHPMVPREKSSGEVPYCFFRKGWAYAPNHQTKKMWYKRLGTVQLGCMGSPGICLQKGILKCEADPKCSAISWWIGAMGQKIGLKNNGDAGSIFMVSGVTMANLGTTALPHNGANTMVKHGPCNKKVGCVGPQCPGAPKKPKADSQGNIVLATSCGNGAVRVWPGSGFPKENVPLYPQIRFCNKWYHICGHYFWNNNIGATTFCQMIGFKQGQVSTKQGMKEVRRNQYAY